MKLERQVKTKEERSSKLSPAAASFSLPERGDRSLSRCMQLLLIVTVHWSSLLCGVGTSSAVKRLHHT